MKITNNDTIYVYHHWMSMDFHSGKTPFKLYQMYAGVMCENDRKKLDKLIGSDGLNLFLPNYYENFEDGSFYAINLVKENTDKTIFVHARNVPAALDSLAGFLYDLKHRILLMPVNKTISFKTAGAVVPPPIKFDLIKQQ
ncbi:hypothetical protein [Paludibacter jiangxiensis]|nr:hypothetical protein [Paludibacter jiangxiensis]